MKRLLMVIPLSVAVLSEAADKIYDDTREWQFIPDGETAVLYRWDGTGTSLEIPRTVSATLDGVVYDYTVVALSPRSIREGALTKVTIPETVTKLDIGVFANTTNLTTLVFSGDKPALEMRWFGEIVLDKLTVYARMDSDGWAEDLSAGVMTETVITSSGTSETYTIPIKSITQDESYTVTASPVPGVQHTPFLLTLACSRAAPEDRCLIIHYTIDGTSPTLYSPRYSEPVTVSSNTTVKCFAAVYSTNTNIFYANGPSASFAYTFPLADGGPYAEKVSDRTWTFRVFGEESYLCPPSHAMPCVDPAPRGALAIPPELGGRPVVGVDVSAFERCRYLTDVTFPATITTIGSFAFKDCIRLTNLVWQGTVPAIDLAAFDGCPIKVTGVTPTEPQTVHVAATIVPDDDGNVAVPESWTNDMVVLHGSEWRTTYIARFGEDFTNSLTKATGKKDAFGNDLEVWQDYVAGTDPLNPDDVFTAGIAMTDEGPEISWSPDLRTATPARVYKIYGMKTLGSKLSSVDVTALTPAERKALDYRFFYVTVSLSE